MKKVTKLLQHAEYQLGALRHKAAKLNDLTHELQYYLPQDWQGHCFVARLEEQKLTITTTQQSLITLLRFMQPQLIQQFRSSKSFKSVKEIHITYAPPAGFSPTNYPQPNISEDAIQACESALDNCPTNIQKALKKLIETLKQKK